MTKIMILIGVLLIIFDDGCLMLDLIGGNLSMPIQNDIGVLILMKMHMRIGIGSHIIMRFFRGLHIYLILSIVVCNDLHIIKLN